MTIYTSGTYWHTTVLDGKTIRWCSHFAGDAIVQAIIDPESGQPARRVLDDGTAESLGDGQTGLTVYGRYAGDRPTVSRVSGLTPEYAYLMAGLEDGRGLTLADDYPQPLDLHQVAGLLGITYATAKLYSSRGRLGEPDVMVGRSPRWYASTVEAARESWPGRGARTDLRQDDGEGDAEMQVEINELGRWGDEGWKWTVTLPPLDAGMPARTFEGRTNKEGCGLFGRCGPGDDWGQSLGTIQFHVPDDEAKARAAILAHYRRPR